MAIRTKPNSYTTDGVSITFDLNDIDALALQQYSAYTITAGRVTVLIANLPGGVLPW